MLLGRSQETGSLKYINCISHEGKVVVFGTNIEGDIWYTVKQDGFEDSYLIHGQENPSGWEQWKKLEIPHEEDDDESVRHKEKEEFADLIRSIYKKDEKRSACAPVQLVSGLGYIYVFRQSRKSMLLVDRFVLDGMANTLVPKFQVRFKRSEQKYQPSQANPDLDSLDFKNMNGEYFYEPTTELRLINRLQKGCFSVVLLPTYEHDKYRWHIFAYNKASKKIELMTLRASDEGLFAVNDYLALDPQPRNIPGIIKRKLDIKSPVNFRNGIAATKYDIQKERETDSGPQLIREAVKVMVVIPTNEDNTVALSFSVAADGTLSQISEEPENFTILKSDSRQILLPPSTIDDIMPVGTTILPDQGLIKRIEKGANNSVTIKIDPDSGNQMNGYQTVQISDMSDASGEYIAVKTVDEDTFEIRYNKSSIGKWKSIVDDDEQDIVYNGKITAYQITGENTLQVKAFNHGLSTGDSVKIIDSCDYNGIYTITKVDNSSFSLNNVQWQPGKALNVNLQSEKRRGITFKSRIPDNISIAFDKLRADEVTYELWFKSTDGDGGLLSVVNRVTRHVSSDSEKNDVEYHDLFLDDRAISGRIIYPEKNTLSLYWNSSNQQNLADGNWHHVAFVVDRAAEFLQIYLDGVNLKLCSRNESRRGFRERSETIKIGGEKNSIGFQGQISDARRGFRERSETIKIGGEKNSIGFQGQISDVRIWGICRTEEQIRDNRFHRLTGKEVGLIGYWPMEHIIEENGIKKTSDISVNGNDGVVNGDAYASGIELLRKLPGKNIDVLKFENDELISVAERGTYTESFEFKSFQKKSKPNNSDGQGNSIFKFIYKGKKDRRAKEWIEIEGTTSIEPIPNRKGWYLAKGKCTIPDGVSLLRSFGIGEFAGNWEKLEIRRHKIQFDVNKITKEVYFDDITLEALADEQKDLRERLQAFAKLEEDIAAKKAKKHEYQKKLTLLKDVGHLNREIESIGGDIEEAEAVLSDLKVDLDYWVLQKKYSDDKVKFYKDYNFKGTCWESGIGITNPISYWDNKLDDRKNDKDRKMNNKVSSIKVPYGLRVHLYSEDNIRRSIDKWQGYLISYNNIDINKLKRKHNDELSSYVIETIKGERSRPTILNNYDDSLNKWESKKNDILIFEENKEKLISDKDNRDEKIREHRIKIKDIKLELEELEVKVKEVVKSFLKKCDEGVHYPMKSVGPNSESALETTGAILSSVQPQSRIHLLETCEGNVQLSYYDDRGKLCQWHFDAVADSKNIKFQEWIPSKLRSCLNLEGENDIIQLNKPIVLDNEWSIEAWFYYPLPITEEWNSLTRGSNFNIVAHKKNHIVQLGIYIDGKFSPICRIDHLSTGWHHLAIVASIKSADEENDEEEPKKFNFTINGENLEVTSQSERKINTDEPDKPIENVKNLEVTVTGRNLSDQRDENKDSVNIKITGDNLTLTSGENTPELDLPEGESNFEVDFYGDNLRPHFSKVREGNYEEPLADPKDYECRIDFYIDGGQEGSITSPNATGTILYLGNKANMGNHQFGKLAEVRIWECSLKGQEIQTNSKILLTGNEPGLLAYYPMREGSGTVIRNFTGKEPDGKCMDTTWWLCSEMSTTSPESHDAVIAAEYCTVGLDPKTQERSAMMRRLFAMPTSDGVQMYSDKRIEQLELKWIGNGQFAPTLVGFIEGPPPIPSENLTYSDDYNGATSVELALSDDVQFNWNRTQDVGLGASIDLFIGAEAEAQAGASFGVTTTTKILDVKHGLKAYFDSNYQWQNESSINSGHSSQMADRLELRGTQECGANFPHLGRRFIPKNVGYALVVSSLADIFITRLQRTKRMIGYQVIPVEGIPPDINTITFLINPAYTMSGSLDGLTGSRATSQRFYKHVPKMRAKYGSLYPASYYDPQFAYLLKLQIEQEDRDREAYFAQFNAGLLDESSLNREINKGEDPNEDDGEGLKSEAGVRSDIIMQNVNDQESRIHALDSFAKWQKKMEDIFLKAGKRNIANTYVWDADGGLRREIQSFANSAEHTIGGSFSLNAGVGVDAKFGLLGFATELTALATVNMTQTMSKSEARSRGIELDVDLSGVEARGITDYNDYPIMPGEKVDRYRFMSFYLEGKTDHFKDFFDHVVDPEWLASNDEEARALRQVQSGSPNKTWRVLHRVTYVERPALMDFGRDLRSYGTNGNDESDTTQALESLQKTVSKLQAENDLLLDKVDRILKVLATEST